MSCGDKYAHLLRTATGLTPADPCPSLGKLCVTGAYDSWLPVADRVAREAKRRIDLLSEASEPVPPQIQDRASDFFASMEDLPRSTWSDPFTLERAMIDRLIEVAREGTCVMEILDGQIEAAGLQQPETGGSTDPKPEEHPIADAIGTVAVFALVGGATYAVYKVSQASKTS